MNNHNQKNSRLDAFGKKHALNYDQNNAYLAPINTNLHYLIEILLSDLSATSKILCVGAGTGAEIIALAKAFPKFTFVALEPSEAMLEVCQERIQGLGLADRCQLINGVIHDVPELEDFDAALCLLVLHHASEEERQEVVAGVAKRLKKEGCFITSELSVDLLANTAESVLKNWQSLSRRANIPEEKFQLLPEMLQQHLGLMSPSDHEDLLKKSGFELPVQFFQSFLIRAWCARK